MEDKIKSPEKSKILVVEDSKVNQLFLKKFLEEQYDLVFVSEGEKVYESVLKSRPDLILLDVIMEGIDGYEVCSQLKHNPETSGIPVIFVTGKDSNKDEAYGLEIGAIDYIHKPYSPPILLARLRNHLELKHSRDKLEAMSYTDGLTGVYNRRWFNDKLKTEWESARIRKSPISLILMDIDFFKKYNDTYGHLAGDDCLKLVASAVDKEVSGDGRIVARYGGEEFVCILPDTDKARAEQIAEGVQKAVRELGIVHEKSEIHKIVTVSQGVITSIPAENRESNEFIKAADDLLYQAKENGRNRFVSGDF